MPRVSVCVPVFNGERFLERALQSVAGQSFSDLELIVIDNASTDGSLAVAGSVADPRIVVHSNPRNIGAAANWNRAVGLASGEYLKILCADDVLEPECLERQVEALDAEPTAAMCACGRVVIDEDGRALLTRRWGRQTRVLAGRDLLAAMVRRGTNLVGEPSAVLVRSRAIRGIDGFDESAGYAVDMEMWSRLLEHGDVVMIPQGLVRYRISTSSWSVAAMSRQASDTIAILRQIVRRTPTLGNRLAFFLGCARAHINRALRWALYLARLRRIGRP